MKNISRYNKSRFFSLICGIIPSFISLFLPRDKQLVVFNSFHNLSFSDNTKYLFLYMRGTEAVKIRYVINDDSLRDSLNKQYGDYFIETKSFKGKIYALRSSLWFINAFELPVSGFLLRFRRTVIHFGHGAPIKNSGLCEKDISLVKKIYYAFLRTNISYTVTSSEVFRAFLAKHIGFSKEHVLLCSYPRYDALNWKFQNVLEKRNGEKFILYAPTWRHYSNVTLFPFEDLDFKKLQRFLLENQITIFLRLHPRFENSDFGEVKLCENIKLFSGRDYPEINEWLSNFDALITDYSSIMYDFMLLDRPIMYFDYDYEEYEKHIGFAVNYKKYAIGYHIRTQDSFIESINDAFSNDSFKVERENVCKIVSEIESDSCESVLRQLKKMNIL